jgi:hypothetical protein
MLVNFHCPSRTERNQVIEQLLDYSTLNSVEIRRLRDDAFSVIADNVTDDLLAQVVRFVAQVNYEVVNTGD